MLTRRQYKNEHFFANNSITYKSWRYYSNYILDRTLNPASTADQSVYAFEYSTSFEKNLNFGASTIKERRKLSE